MYAQLNYCGLRKGKEYYPVNEGFDWYLVKTKGILRNIPKWVLDFKPPKSYNRSEDEEEIPH